MQVPGWPVAFRGSLAVRAGLVTPDRLRGPAFVRLLPDVYVPASQERHLALRSLAAYRYVEHVGGVVAGYSAAALLGASCGRRDAPAEVIVPGGGARTRPGLVVHRDTLTVDEDHAEVVRRRGVRVTSPIRTAYDLARWAPDVTEAVVAVDALARADPFEPDLLLHMIRRHRRARGNDRLYDVLALADAKAGSPMETRLRLLLVGAGLPRPVCQHVVQYPQMRRAVWLDLAYPEHKVGIEYEGAGHTTPEQVLRDAGRYTRLVDEGWRIYRYTRLEMRDEPDRIVAQVRRALRHDPPGVR